MRHTSGDSGDADLISGVEATDGDLKSHLLIEGIKLGVALSPADGELSIGAGGLGGDEDAIGATLGVTGVSADIVAGGHEEFPLSGLKGIGRVIKAEQPRCPQCNPCWAWWRA